MRKTIFAALACVALSLASAAQTGVVPFHSSRETFLDQNGIPLANGCIFTYLGGTTTAHATYTDYTGGTQNPNPVILDATGSAVMWLDANNYKFIAYSYGGIECATGAPQWTVDQIPGDAFLNGTISGATITNPTISGGTQSGTTISGVTVASSNINSTPIGATTPAAGAFTQLSGALDAMSYSATPVFAAGSYSTFTIALSGNVTSSTVTGSATGQMINFGVCQNATGGYSFAWPANFVNPPAMPSGPLACMTPSFFYDGSSWQLINFESGSSAAAYDSMAWSATPVFVVNPYFVFALTLTGNVTSSTIAGSTAGQLISMNLCQNSTGGYSFVWPGSFLNPPAIPQAPSACITPQFFFNGTVWTLLNQTSIEGVQTQTFSATPSFNAAAYNQFPFTLGGNVVSSTLTGGTLFQIVNFNICQNATGGYGFAWPANLLNAPTVTSTASACTNTTALFNGANWIAVASTTGGGTSVRKDCLSVPCAGGSTYADGTVYTNSTSSRLEEEVSMIASGPCTGNQYTLDHTINGVAIPGNEVYASCSGHAKITFDVLPGETFSAVVATAYGSGGTPSITSWSEINW